MAKKELESILKELKSVYTDIRAEVLVSEILENSQAELADFSVQNQSTFKRPYRRDILDFKNSLVDDKNYTIALNLTRNGIYDSLPEGVFHDVAEPNLKGIAYQRKRKQQKQEEKEARKFFQPIENEVFNQFVAIEREERASINRFSNIKDNFLLYFWQIDQSLPSDFIIKLVKLLPYAHHISGNYALTALCLEKIIGEKVSIYKQSQSLPVSQPSKNTETIMGVNMVLELKTARVIDPQIEVKIGPVKKENVKNFVDGSNWMKFIDTFYEYFIPMEIKVNTKIDLARSQDNFILNEIQPEILGLTTTL